MNVAFVLTSTGWGGLELNTLKLAKGLEEKGCSVYFVIRKDSRVKKEIQSHFKNNLELSNVKRYFDFKNAKIVRNFLIENDIKIVFTSFRPDLDLISWVKRSSKKSIRVIHQQQMQIGIAKKGVMQRMRYKCIDSWVAPLEWLKSEVLEKTTIKENIISIIPLGVDVKQFEIPFISQNEAQGIFKCSTQDTLIGVIGRIDPKKGQLFLVQAIERLRNEGKNVSLLIVGEPTINDAKGKAYYDELIQYIKVNHLENNIYIADFTTNVAAFYKAIDVFVMSSVGETYGMVTLEALLSNKPVIGTNSGGTPELLGHGKYGELYEVDDLKSFCDGYSSLIKRVSNDELNAEKIRKHVVENYRLEREVDGVFELIQSQLSE